MPAQPPPKSSRLVPLGISLTVFGVVASGLLQGVLPSMPPGVLRSLALISADLVIGCIIAGAWLVLAGKRTGRR